MYRVARGGTFFYKKNFQNILKIQKDYFNLELITCDRIYKNILWN